MAKEFYKILEINENASAEEIKKAYRKLALKWHPDRWNTKGLEERQKANEEMQKVNKAFEVLGDEEKKKKYDLGESDFSTTGKDTESFEEYIQRMNEQDEARMEDINDQLRKLKLLAKFLLRREIWSIIHNEMLVNGVRQSHLDNNLWAPFSDWGDKLYDIEIGDDDNDKEGIDRKKINVFKEKMIKAIQEKKIQLAAERMAKANSDLERTKLKAIETIKKELKNRGLKIEDLEEEYYNYEEVVNSLSKKLKIRSYEDKVMEAIRRKFQNGRFKTKQDGFSWQEQSEELDKETEELQHNSSLSDNSHKKLESIEKEEPPKDRWLVKKIKKRWT